MICLKTDNCFVPGAPTQQSANLVAPVSPAPCNLKGAKRNPARRGSERAAPARKWVEAGMNPVTTDWSNFFVAQVGAAAALTGLVVVAISVNLSRILSFAQLPGRAAEALITLTGALVLTSLGLVPQAPSRFGAEVLAIGLLAFMGPLIIQLRSRRFNQDVSPTKRSLRMFVSAAVSLPLIVGGALLLSDSGAGLYWIAAGVILSLVAGVYGAWVLLVEILR